MHRDMPSDTEVQGWLQTLGVASMCQWDVLLFLYRHSTSLVGADHIGRLLGYGAEPVLAALDLLESLGLVARSRVSQNTRLYQFTVPNEPLRREAVEGLGALGDSRAGRLLLAKQLKREAPPPPAEGLGTARLFEEMPQLLSPDGGMKSWRKAI